MSNGNLRDTIKNLQLFAKTYLTVRSKEGIVTPFLFNRAQQYLHERLESQLKKTGKVRALVLKGRQQGVSTYVQLRYFHKVITTKGKYAFILTHKSDATKNLFNMTKRYYDMLPGGLAPSPEKSSVKELYFKSLDSGYFVGTAGSKSTGRSFTIQLMHGSEVAFWENTDDIQTGLLQTIPGCDNTEIILESTANGIGNYFHNMWTGACAGKNGYQAIFVPWYWQDEYSCSVMEGDSVHPTDEEESFLDLYRENGLTMNHLYWRRLKIREFSNDQDKALEKFNTEYPFTALEAFRNPIENRFIHASLVQKARAQKVESESPLVIGVDPAISDNDATAIVRRKGRQVYNIETFHNLNTMELAGKVRRIIDLERPSRVCIDCIGVGAGVVDRLKEMGYSCVEGVNVARSANDKDKFRNLRAELWHDMREWLAQDAPIEIPDSDELLGDLTSLGYKYDSSGRLQIESKDDLRKRGMKSPDTADALALTFSVGDYLANSGYQTTFIPDRMAGMFT